MRSFLEKKKTVFKVWLNNVFINDERKKEVKINDHIIFMHFVILYVVDTNLNMKINEKISVL